MIIDGHLHIAGDPGPILSRMDALGIARTVLVGVGVRDRRRHSWLSLRIPPIVAST